MEWVGGTKEAVELINELLKSGDLINYYSYDWFNSSDINSHRSRHILDDIIEEHGNDCLNHLLIGCFHDNDGKLRTLIELSTAVQGDERWNYTNDCFTFINLKTQSILYMGITTRKRHYHEFMINGDDLEDFEMLDHHNIVSEFREIVEDELAENMNQLHYNGWYSSELYEYVLGANGLYHSEYDVDDIEKDSEEGFTKEELDEKIKDAEEKEKIIADEMQYLQQYFPKFSTDYIYE